MYLQSGQIDKAETHFADRGGGCERARSVESVFVCGALHMSTEVIWVKTNHVCLFPVFMPITAYILPSRTNSPSASFAQAERAISSIILKNTCLVGAKTNYDSNGNLKFPSRINRGLDADVIVSEVHGLIERMCSGGRKIEIFGRKHSPRPGWVISHKSGRQCYLFERWQTLGNQLGETRYEEDLATSIKARSPSL